MNILFCKSDNSIKTNIFNIIPSVIFIQQIMRVTRWIVLPLPIKALYKFGCFEGILQRAKFAMLLIYWVSLTRFCMIFNMFYLISKYQFCVKNLKMKRKKDKKFLTIRSRDSNPRFSIIFPPTIWVFMEGEGDEIKSRLGS